MKLSSVVLCLMSLGSAAAADFGLAQVRTVYLLPMSGGMDQFVAHHLTSSGRYQVVTDPALADAVLTDRIGTEFEDKMRELYPPPPPPPSEDGDADEEKEPAVKKQTAEREDPSVASLMGQASGGRRTSTFSRSKGNLFLVDRKSNLVLWSAYLRPRSTRPDDLNRAAGELTDRLDDAAGRQVKRMSKAQPAPAK